MARAKRNPVVPTPPSTPSDGVNRPLTSDEALFVDSYLIYRRYAAAYREVFPATSWQNSRRWGWEWGHRPHVEAEIRAAIRDQRTRKRATADGVIDELARIAFSDILDLYDPATQNLRHPRHIPFETRRAISSMRVQRQRVTETTQSGGRGRPTTTTRIVDSIVEYKLWNKTEALAKIANHLGLNTELPPLESLLRLLPTELASQVRSALTQMVQNPRHQRNGTPIPNGAQT